VPEAADGELLLRGEAERDLAAEAAGQILRAVGIATLAPGIERESADDRAGLVADGDDRAQVVGVEIVGRDRLGIDEVEAHADGDVADGQILVPLAAAGDDQLGAHPEGGEAERGDYRASYQIAI